MVYEVRTAAQSVAGATASSVVAARAGADASASVGAGAGAVAGARCWKYALQAIINRLLLYFLVHDNRLLSMLELY